MVTYIVYQGWPLTWDTSNLSYFYIHSFPFLSSKSSYQRYAGPSWPRFSWCPISCSRRGPCRPRDSGVRREARLCWRDSCLIFEKLSGEEPGHSRGRLVTVILSPLTVTQLVLVEILTTVTCGLVVYSWHYKVTTQTLTSRHQTDNSRWLPACTYLCTLPPYLYDQLTRTKTRIFILWP